MGNSWEREGRTASENDRRQGNICDMTNAAVSSGRCSLEENIADKSYRLQPNNNKVIKEARTHKSLDIKTKQKLSLSNQPNSQPSIKFNKRSASNDSRPITFTQIEKTVSEYRPSIIINGSAPTFNVGQSQQMIKKVGVRPRDLPRKSSTEKVIIFPQPTMVKRVPLEPKVILNGVRPAWMVNYVKQAQPMPSSHHCLQSSIVTPFVPPTTAQLHHLQERKTLKKVAMNRSHAAYNSCEEGTNNGEESDGSKQNENKRKLQSQLIESRINLEQSQQLFTDPSLYTYITNKQHPFAQEIKPKYALPTHSPTKPHLNAPHPHSTQKFQINIRPATNKPMRLQQAIPDEVESKPLIQADMYRFPTLTDFSEDSKTDNTSFIPLIPNTCARRQLEGEELLRYCRPKIDEMVLADLRKLPTKN